MPGFDRKGPEGQGSQTGRKLGKCNPNGKKNNENIVEDDSIKGIGMRRGRGGGKGLGKRNGQGRRLERGNS